MGSGVGAFAVGGCSVGTLVESAAVGIGAGSGMLSTGSAVDAAVISVGATAAGVTVENTEQDSAVKTITQIKSRNLC